MTVQIAPLDQLVSIRDVCRMSGLSKTTVYALIAAGKFPKQTFVGTAARWSLLEVQHWIEEQLNARRTA